MRRMSTGFSRAFVVVVAVVAVQLTTLTLFASAQTASSRKASASQPTVKVAAIQAISQMGKPQQNRDHLETLIRQAADRGARIIVLPETAITGYMDMDTRTTWQVDDWKVTAGLKGISPKAAAETVPGPSTGAFARLSKELGIYLTVPLLEVDPKSGKYFNTLVLVGPDGTVLLHYRKLNPWPWAERSWASRGDHGHQYIDTPYGRLGLLICYDINYEPPMMAESKVDMLLYSIAWVENKDSTWFDKQLPDIAARNRLNIIGANWTVAKTPAWHGYGESEIIDRSGRILSRVSKDIGEEIIYADLPIQGADAGGVTSTSNR